MREDRRRSEDRDQIVGKLRDNKGIVDNWQILSFITLFLFFVFFSLSAVYGAGIEDTIRAYLKEHYPWAEIEVKDLSFDGNIPQGDVRRIYIDRRPPGRSLFTIQYANGEKLLVAANIKAFDWVVMSRRPQGKGYVLNEDDLYKALMDVTKIPRGAFKEIDEATGKTLKRSIVSNSPLTKEMFAEGMAVKKGSKVMIIAESSSFVITTTGELKENGYIGSPVKAINLASKKTIKGILIDENKLKVEF